MPFSVCRSASAAAPIGSLNVYVHTTHEWLDEEVAALETYGQLLNGLLSTALAAHQRGQVVDQLEYALGYRVVIERGVGYLMARHHLGAVEAFNLLRRAARDRQRRVVGARGPLVDTAAYGRQVPASPCTGAASPT